MYRDPIQWKRIRDRVLKQGKSQRKVSRETGLSRATVAKMVAHKIPLTRKRRTHFRPTLGPHIFRIERLAAEAAQAIPKKKPSATEIFEHLRAAEDYFGSYSAVRDYVSLLWKTEPRNKNCLDLWEHARDTLTVANREDSISFLQAMSNGKTPSLSKTKLKAFMRATVLYAKKTSPSPIEPSAEDRARDWLHSIALGKTSRGQIVQDIGECDDLSALLKMVQSGNRIIRNRALSILASKKDISARATNRILGVDRRSCTKYLNLYKEHGADGLMFREPSSNRKFDSKPLKDSIFALLHEPPSNYDINRTTWKMVDFKEILSKNGYPACPEVIRNITKSAGYRWRKARVVLTSQDPEYRCKLQKIQSILSDLKPDEVFFSIDEFGPFAVKMKGGRSLVGPGEIPVIPQWQKSKGCLILTAALELSSNQVTHFYSKKKNTNEMIKLMDILVQKYADRKRLFLSWDAASWHIAKKLYEYIENHNRAYCDGGRPQVQTAPLPSGAQFLNVIESIFSGMARAIIHNSDYGSVEDAQSAIDRYFSTRNEKFIQNPRRAGKMIWGNERELAVFSPSNNCKDPHYR